MSAKRPAAVNGLGHTKRPQSANGGAAPSPGGAPARPLAKSAADGHAIPAITTMGKMPEFAVEIAEDLHKLVEGGGKVVTQVTKSSALRAFRKVEMVGKLPSPVMNASGNLRGMVVSKSARTVFNFSMDLAEKFEKYDKALVLAGIVIELAKETGRIKNVYYSDRSGVERGREIVLITSTAVLRSLTSVVPFGAHILAKSLEGYLELGSVVSGNDAPLRWSGELSALDAKVTATHSEIFDPAFMDRHGQQAVGDLINWVDVHVHAR